MFARRLLQGLVATAALLAGAAQASTIYTFDTTAVAGFGAGPYGTVTLTQNGADVDVRVDLRSDMNFVTTGGPHVIFGMNLSGAVAADFINITFAGGSNGTIGVTVNQDASPYGTFALAIDCTASCTNGAPGTLLDPLTFTVKNALVADFAHTNAGGSYFVADAICSRSTVVGCNGSTGSITVKGAPQTDTDTDTDTDVPEPGTLALLGLGLIGIGAARRRKA